jgi:hypothetical protein
MIKPDEAPMASYYLSVMIHKMKAKKVWDDWQRYGFGDDPICKDNIMYKGHLNLMYGLYQLMTGSDRYAKEFTWLTQKIVEEVEQSKLGKFRGVVCEPDRYFVQCNAIGLLSLEIYDRLYGTPYAKYYGEEVMKFVKERLIDPETGLYREAYHPSHDIAIPYLSGYTNAWTMVMLRPLIASISRRFIRPGKRFSYGNMVPLQQCGNHAMAGLRAWPRSSACWRPRNSVIRNSSANCAIP